MGWFIYFSTFFREFITYKLAGVRNLRSWKTFLLVFPIPYCKKKYIFRIGYASFAVGKRATRHGGPTGKDLQSEPKKILMLAWLDRCRECGLYALVKQYQKDWEPPGHKYCSRQGPVMG